MDGNEDRDHIHYTSCSYIFNQNPDKEINKLEVFAVSKKGSENAYQDDNSSSLPPTYDSIFGQFKDEKGGSGSSFEYLKIILVMFAGTVGCTLSLTLLLSLPMAMIVIGVKYKDVCPLEPFIPIYLIVGGSFGIVKMVSIITQRTAYNGDIFATNIEDEANEDERPIAWMFVDGVLNLFLFTWFVAGNIWVYSKYKPNFVPPPHEPLNYCNKTVYLFSFWVISASYIILSMICLCTCCLALCASCTAYLLTVGGAAAVNPEQGVNEQD